MVIQTIPIKVDRRHEDRYLATVSLIEIAKAIGAPVRVVYTNNLEPGAVAGNHFHKRKREVFRAAHGRFLVAFQDIKTGKRVELCLDANPANPDFRCIVVPFGVAHAVENLGTDIGRLDVFASDEARQADDDFPFEVMKRVIR